MSVRALADKKFIRKYIYLALAGLGFFLWGVYDAVYKFPVELEMAEAFDQIKDQIKDQEDPAKLWQKLAMANEDKGWEIERPDNSAEVVRGYMKFNSFIIVGGLGLLSFFLLKYFRTKESWMESTETGINTSWGKSLEFENITKINKHRWEAKGIAKVTYEDAVGVKRTMIFDDFKYDREPMGELMAMCEAKRVLEASQIVGGKSQATIAEEKAKANDEEASEPETDESETDVDSMQS